MPRIPTQVLLLVLTLFVVMLGFGIVIPVLPFLARRVGAGPVEMGLLITVWSGAQFLTAPLWGDLSDRVGRKPVLVVGMIGFGLSFFFMAAARSYTTLLLARLAGGLLSAAALPTAQALVADLTRPEERGAAMGLVGGVIGLGFLFGPMFGGILAPLGITVPFVAAGVLGLAAPMGLLVLREPPRQEKVARQPLIISMRQALRSPYALLFWLAFGGMFGASSMFSMIGYYFIDRLQGSPGHVGLAFTLLGLGGTVAQFGLVGLTIRLWGEERTARSGLVLGAMGFAAIAATPTMPTAIAAVALTGVGTGLLRPAITSLLSKRARQGMGLTMGVQTAFDSLGRTVGPLWAGMIYGVNIRAPFISASATFLLFLALTLSAASKVGDRA